MDLIEAITKLLMALAAVVGPPSAAYVAHIRRQERKEARERGETALTDKEPPPIGMGPVILLVLAGAAWAYLISKEPQLARLLPSAESAELATAEAAKPRKTASISRSVCTSSKDCPSGQGCDRGRCSVPRKLSELKDGANCAGCESLPWMEAPAPALALR